MDCRSGDIYEIHIDDDVRSKNTAMRAFELALESKKEEYSGRNQIPLQAKQYEELKPMGAKSRKGYMRNQPCVCGSGEKFKKCCWNDYS